MSASCPGGSSAAGQTDADGASDAPPPSAEGTTEASVSDGGARDASLADGPYRSDAASDGGDAGDVAAVTPEPSSFGSVQGRVAYRFPTVPLPGTGVTLRDMADASVATGLTNANGVYAFYGVPPGTYHLDFDPRSGVSGPVPYETSLAQPFAVGDAAVVVNASCTGNDVTMCAVPADSDPLHRILIVDPVVTSAERNPATANDDDGALSFRHVLETLSGCPDAFAPCVGGFVQDWLTQLGTEQWIDAGTTSFAVPPREASNVRWPVVGETGLPDMAQTPFRLLAIVNRTDLAGEGGLGQARLLYGYVGSSDDEFTIELDFDLPASTDLPDRAAWVRAFHDLPVPDGCDAGASASARCDYAARVAALVARFVDPALLRGFRTSDLALAPPALPAPPWAWRQFTLVRRVGGNALVTAPTLETPDSTLNGSTALADFLVAHSAEIRDGLVSLPPAFVGGEAFALDVESWTFPGVDEATATAMSGRTCNGCHGFLSTDPYEPGTRGPMLHVDPSSDGGESGTDMLSPFVKYIEFPRRGIFMSEWLACDGGPGSCPAPVDIELTQPL